MSRMIEQRFYNDVEIKKDTDGDITIYQCSDSTALDTKGASELIKALQEWVDGH